MNRLLQLQTQLIRENPKVKDFAQLKGQGKVNKDDLMLSVYGPNYEWRLKALAIIRQNPNIYIHYNLLDSSRAQQRHQATKQVFFTRKTSPITHQIVLADPNKLTLFGNGYVWYDLALSVKSGVHVFLYMKAIQNLGKERHQTLFLRASNYNDLGCFGLTELTHGSNVKGIMTEAHYDHQQRQFIINTPTKEAMKFWIGGAASTANMAVIWAQLYISGKCYGVHAYVVPLRDNKTHKLLPGVLVGDCGPKNGLNAIDNGFIIFDNVRIPVDNQLNRISGVNDKGEFQSIVENQDKRFGLQLSALSGGRFHIAVNSATMALCALTIAIRYSCCRRQFSDKLGQPQHLLIEYPLTKRRIMPLLAQTIVSLTANMASIFAWDQNSKKFQDITNPATEQLHAISSIMKAKSSWFASQCIKQCRQILGGNGYSLYSKLSWLYNDNDVNITWEGDNDVLIQQTTKFILSTAQKIIQKGEKTHSKLLEFMTSPPNELWQVTTNNLLNLQHGLHMLQYKIVTKVQQMGMKMMTLRDNKMPLIDIWNNSQVYLGKAIVMAYGDLFMLTKMLEKISASIDPTNTIILKQLTTLWLLKVYREDEYIDQVHYPLIENLIMEYSERLALNSLAILDALAADDDIIGSPFADPNGNGMTKYFNIVMSKNKANNKPSWWKILAERQPYCQDQLHS